MRWTLVPLCLTVSVLMLPLLGCGSSTDGVPYEGTISLNGQSLADATVTLMPMTANGPGPFSGTSDSAGKFALGPSASTDVRGVTPGEYRLMISTLKVAPQEVADDSAPPQILAPERVPDNYRTGNMRVEVPPEGTTAANFDITSRQ